jgi:hypothetical protein
MAPTLFTTRNTLPPPEGALRLRPGKASSAAPALIELLAAHRMIGWQKD